MLFSKRWFLRRDEVAIELASVLHNQLKLADGTRLFSLDAMTTYGHIVPFFDVRVSYALAMHEDMGCYCGVADLRSRLARAVKHLHKLLVNEERADLPPLRSKKKEAKVARWVQYGKDVLAEYQDAIR